MAYALPGKEFLTLVDAIEEQVETVAMMQLAQTGAEEWNEEGEEA